MNLSPRKAVLSGYAFAARKSAISDRSSKTRSKTFPRDSHLTAVCKNSSTCSEPNSSHSTLNKRVLSARPFIKLTTRITQVITSLNESGRVLVMRAWRWMAQCTLVSEGAFFFANATNPDFTLSIAGSPSVQIAPSFSHCIPCFAK